MRRARAFILCCCAWWGAASAAPVNVTFWHAFKDDLRSSWIARKAVEFGRVDPRYRVLAVSKGTYRENFAAAVRAAVEGNAPALVQLDEASMQLAVDSGLFQPASRVAPVDYADYLDAVRRYYTVQGTIHSLPFNSSSPVLYLNERLARQAGLDPGAPYDTFGRITRACEAARRARLAASCITFPLNSWLFEQWAAQQGALLVDRENGRAGRATRTYLNSPAVKRAATWLKTLHDAGHYRFTGRIDDVEASLREFAEGRALFMISSTSRLGNVTAASVRGGFAFRVGFMPVPDGVARQGVVVSGGSLWITREVPPEVAEGARAFALFLTNTRNAAEWHVLSGYYPVRTSSVELLERQGRLKSGPGSVAFEQLRTTRANPATSGAVFGSFYDVRVILERALLGVLRGAAVDAALDGATREADRVVREYNANF